MRPLVLLVALLLIPLSLSPDASAEPKTEDAGYLPSLLVVGLSCSSEEHSLIPKDPTDPWTGHPLGWAFSGEPECAPADAMNKKREMDGEERVQWGFGAVAFVFTTEDTGTLATASATDAVFGEDAGYLTVRAMDEDGGYVSSEGCGTQSIILPEPTVPWQSAPPPDWALWWTFVPEVGVDEDLTVCFATTGIIHGTWGA